MLRKRERGRPGTPALCFCVNGQLVSFNKVYRPRKAKGFSQTLVVPTFKGGGKKELEQPQ